MATPRGINPKVVNTFENVRKYADIFTPEFYEKNKMDNTLPFKVMTAYFKKVRGYILEGHVVHLPLGYGTIAVEGYRPPIVQKIPNSHGGYRLKGLTINWNETHKLWDKDKDMLAKRQCVYNTNEATDGFQYRLVLNRNTRYKKGTRFYTSSKMKRAIREILQSDQWERFPKTIKPELEYAVTESSTRIKRHKENYKEYLEAKKKYETNKN